MAMRMALQNWPLGKPARWSLWQLFKQGVVGGFLAGMSFIVFEMIVAWLLQKGFWLPLRMIAAMLAGGRAIEPWYSAFAAASLGLFIHTLFSIAFGILFAVILLGRPVLAATPLRLAGMGAVYGFLLWIFNFYVFAPMFGWFWFPLGTEPFLQGFVAHTVLYGAVLGGYMQVLQRSAPPAPEF